MIWRIFLVSINPAPIAFYYASEASCRAPAAPILVFFHYILDVYLVFNFWFLHTLCFKKVNDLLVYWQLSCPPIGPNYFEQVQIVLDMSKIFWTRPKTLKIMKTSTFFAMYQSHNQIWVALTIPVLRIVYWLVAYNRQCTWVCILRTFLVTFISFIYKYASWSQISHLYLHAHRKHMTPIFAACFCRHFAPRWVHVNMCKGARTCARVCTHVQGWVHLHTLTLWLKH